MTIIFALGSALSIALGTFLTKSVTVRLPGFSSVGVLFYFNALVVLFVGVFFPQWHPMGTGDLIRTVLGGVSTALGAWLIFLVVSRSSASAAGVGQSLSPAVVLLLSPLLLEASITPIQVVLVALIVMAALIPLRGAVDAMSSLATVVLIGAIGICAGSTTALIALQLDREMGIIQILFLHQLIAGSIFLFFYRPRGFTLRDYLALSRRSIFMGVGWVLTVAALASGSAVLVQSVLATIPIWILGFETISARKRPSTNVIVSAIVASTGIVLLSTLFS